MRHTAGQVGQPNRGIACWSGRNANSRGIQQPNRIHNQINSGGETNMSGWQLTDDGPTAYTRYAMPIMEPWTDDLIRQGQCKTGNRVLDIACGTGFVASRVNAVSDAQCKVVGIDINEAMLNKAKKNTSIEWHLGSATKLPFDDSSFDVVLCQQGLNISLIALRP
jgi:SAM-dependent methyltransferase